MNPIKSAFKDFVSDTKLVFSNSLIEKQTTRIGGSLALRVGAVAIAVVAIIATFKVLAALTVAASALAITFAVINLTANALGLTLAHDLWTIGDNIAKTQRVFHGVRELQSDNGSTFLAGAKRVMGNLPGAVRHAFSEVRGLPGEIRGTWLIAPAYRAAESFLATAN